MGDEPLRVALVEPYLGGSHRAWAEGYAARSIHDVEVVGLPAIHWKWRMQGGHVSLVPMLERASMDRGRFDVVLATSMTNLPALLGLARHTLGSARVVLYMHENQLTFPLSPHDEPDLTYAMINWTSMLAADLVVFNSGFHRDAWFDELPHLLARFPDRSHAALIEPVRSRAVVASVGTDLAPLASIERTAGGHPLVLWNQRWEYDTGVVDFVDAVEQLVAEGVPFDVALAGDRPHHDPPSLVRLRAVPGLRLVHDGHAEIEEYRALLRRADIVVSAAHHEFFGVAVTEAVAAGAFPVLPNRLVYPERIPREHRAACLYGEGELAARLRWAIEHPAEIAAVAEALAPAMFDADWSVQAPLLDELVAG